ncbi:MAG: hypothetical protein ABI905_02075 [Betaproteobacteria bacterium]
MFRKGHKLFSFASIGLIVTAFLQIILYASVWQDELATSGLALAMQGYRFDFGPGDPSVMESHESLSIALAVFLIWSGLQNLLIARYTGLRDKLMRRTCTFNLVMIALLLVLFSLYRMLLPVICLAIVEVMFFIARYRLRRSKIMRVPITGMGSHIGSHIASPSGPSSGMPPV